MGVVALLQQPSCPTQIAVQPYDRPNIWIAGSRSQHVKNANDDLAWAAAMDVWIAAVEVTERPRQSMPNPLEQHITVPTIIEFTPWPVSVICRTQRGVRPSPTIAAISAMKRRSYPSSKGTFRKTCWGLNLRPAELAGFLFRLTAKLPALSERLQDAVHALECLLTYVKRRHNLGRGLAGGPMRCARGQQVHLCIQRASGTINSLDG